ncbi:MAG: hypothetical protein IJH37_07470 [Clostridia bacterium]|nr:hypothetical protein [Clostridia bacterium]
MFKSVNFKTSTLFVLLVIVTELVIGGLQIYMFSRSVKTDFASSVTSVFDDEMRQTLTETANTAAVTAVPQTPEDGEAEPEEIILEEAEPKIIDSLKNTVMQKAAPLSVGSGSELLILGSDGGVRFSSVGTESINATEVTGAALSGTEALDVSLSNDYAEYALPLMSDDEVKYVIFIRQGLNVVHSVQRSLWSGYIITLLSSAVIAYLLSLAVTASFVRPLKALNAQTRRALEAERIPIPDSDNTDIIGELGSNIRLLSQAMRQPSDKTIASNTKIEKILQNMKDGILAFDLHGNLTHINPEAKRLLNRNFVDDITFNKFFKEINADITLEQLQYDSDDSSIERVIQLNKQVLQLNFAVFSRESSEGGVIVIIHDITRHERLENARRDFVADVSHELRTPLTVIKSYADILADTPDAEPELRTRFLNTISSETDRMTKIISDLLTLSKLDVDTTYVRPYEDIDIRNMIESLVDRLSLTAKKKEQELVYTPINDVPNLKGDRDGLERVFTNIITNALKYTPSGGRISIFSSKVYNDILVKVSDNGIGIPKEQLPNIFDRFYRVDKARSRDKGGTGLGLAIAKQTIETAFGGKITITSEPNKGTDVSVSIPIPKK